MKKEQSVLNKLAKFTAKEVELSAQEPIEVEFGVQEEAQGLIAKLESSASNLDRLSSLMNQKINEYNAIAKELENGANLADKFYSETYSTYRNSEKYLKDLSVKLKELGMSFNDFPKASLLDKKLDEMGKVMDGFIAIKNILPKTINTKF